MVSDSKLQTVIAGQTLEAALYATKELEETSKLHVLTRCQYTENPAEEQIAELSGLNEKTIHIVMT